MDLYGKLNNEVTLKNYKGASTDTSITTIDGSNIISVDVKKVPNKLTLIADGKVDSFSGDREIIINFDTIFGKTYKINADIQNGVYVGPYYIKNNESLGLLIIPNEGYHLPEEINIENAIKEKYDSVTGELKIGSPNNTVNIIINCI